MVDKNPKMVTLYLKMVLKNSTATTSKKILQNILRCIKHVKNVHSDYKKKISGKCISPRESANFDYFFTYNIFLS